MQPEDELRADHMAIRRGAKVLEHLAHHLREGHGVRNTDMFTLVDLLDRAAGEDHHGKEEQILFAFLRERRTRFGFDGLRSFHEDHDELGDLLADLRELVGPACEGDQRARQRLDKMATRYREATRDHLRREEQTFLDRLHENLSTDEIQDLADRLAAFDGAPKARDRLEDRSDRLANGYEDAF
ncbi:hypothetical protein BRD56_06085 [Thermoplasmatales archaeon SW_10_69_26]|nr:MAG: hypothetical protein BRD56_06085 [Thermoplasmatales archaeon SW_10_69_26]